MRSALIRIAALCLVTCFTFVPTVVFAQSSGTFTVYKDFADSNDATVEITLTCFGLALGGGVTPPITKFTAGGVLESDNKAVFLVTGVFATDAPANSGNYYTPSNCTATETLPTGYQQDLVLSDCVNVQFAPDGAHVPQGGTALASCTIVNTPVCGDNFKSVDEQCDLGIGNGAPQGSCCASDCTFVAAATVCDPGSGDSCDPDEVCDGSTATCPTDVYQASDYVCNASASECDVEELCSGTAGEACPTDVYADPGTLCGTAPDFACDAQTICDGLGGLEENCVANLDHPLAACGVIGKGDGCELNICDSGGPSDFRLLFTPDLPNWVAYKLNASNPGQLFYTLVSEPDVPENANLLLQVPFPFVTQGNMTLHVYDAADAYTEDSCLIIGEGAGSTPYPVEITMDTYWGATGCIDPTGPDFPTTDLEAGAYCLHETDPVGDPGVFDTLCPSDYDPNGGGANLPPPLALQECWAYVPVQLANGEDEQFAARLHLDYGLKGKFLDTYCPADLNVDRYAPAGKGAYGDFDANGIDVSTSSIYLNEWLTTCNIPTCQPYTFKQGVAEEVFQSYLPDDSNCLTGHGGTGCDNQECQDTVCAGDSDCCEAEWDGSCASAAATSCVEPAIEVESAESVVQSVNYFKKPVGIFGRAFCNDDDGDTDEPPLLPLLGDGFAGLKVELYKSGNLALLAKATTDADGYYFLNYKHKGKAAYYVVKLFDNDGVPLLVATAGNNPTPPGNVPLQANGFAEQNFADTDTCSSAIATGWVAENWEITKGKFKTIVNP